MRVEAAQFSLKEGNSDKIQIDLDRVVATIHEFQAMLGNEMLGLRRMLDE